MFLAKPKSASCLDASERCTAPRRCNVPWHGRPQIKSYCRQLFLTSADCPRLDLRPGPAPRELGASAFTASQSVLSPSYLMVSFHAAAPYIFTHLFINHCYHISKHTTCYFFSFLLMQLIGLQHIIRWHWLPPPPHRFLPAIGKDAGENLEECALLFPLHFLPFFFSPALPGSSARPVLGLKMSLNCCMCCGRR